MDLSSKIQLRPILELIQTWILVNIDDEARKAFVASADFAAANTFWHHYSKRARAEKIIEERFAKLGAVSPFKSENLREILPIIGATIHPSYLAISLTAQAHFKNASDSLVYENIENATAFSLSSAILLAMMAFFPFQDFDFSIPDGLHLSGYYAHKTCVNNNELCKKLQRMPALLWLGSAQFSDRLHQKLLQDIANRNSAAGAATSEYSR